MSTEMIHQGDEDSLSRGVRDDSLGHQDGQEQVSTKKTGILILPKLHGTFCSDLRTSRMH